MPAIMQTSTSTDNVRQQHRQYWPLFSRPPQYPSVGMVAGSTGGGFGSGDGELATQIRQQLELLKSKVTETGLELDRCRQEQEAFSVEYYSFRESSLRFENLQQQVNIKQEKILDPS